MLPFLKAPADAPLMTDKHEIDARYRYWRRHILLTIWLGYALFYFTRKSFNSAVPEILANGVLSRSDIGLLATLFYITYGVSKFVSGIVSDRSNARYFMGIGLLPRALSTFCLASRRRYGVCRALGVERLFPGLGFTGVCASVNRLVFSYRARRLVGIMEHGA